MPTFSKIRQILPKVRPGFRADACCVLVGLFVSFIGNFHYGYSTTFLNTPVDEFKDFLNKSLSDGANHPSAGTIDVWWNLVLNIPFAGFFFGLFLNPLLNDKFGRKVGFLTGSLGSLISAILRFTSIWWEHIGLLVFARILTSLCTAATYSSLLLYLQECAPTHLRGTLTFLSEVVFASMCLLGMLLGTDQLLGKNLLALTAVPIAPCLFFLVALFFFPETPKFLFLVKNDRVKAARSIRFYHGQKADVDTILEEMAQEAESKELPSFLKTCRIVLRTDHTRNALILSVVCLQNCVGMWSLLLSSTYFLEQSDVPSTVAEWGSNAMMAAYIAGTIGGAVLIDVYGRRPLLITFTIINVGSLASFVIFDQLHHLADWVKWGCLPALIVYGISYGLAVGPISWFICNELTPMQFRSCVQSLSYAVNTLLVVGLSFAVLPLYDAIGSWAFLPLYVIPSTFSIFYIVRFLPETKNREIHDIVEDLKLRRR
ncbi:unnamed protein product, partial [Mesorhabditis spiculigera]